MGVPDTVGVAYRGVPDVDRKKYKQTKNCQRQGASIPVLATKNEPDWPVNNQDISIFPIVAWKKFWHGV